MVISPNRGRKWLLALALAGGITGLSVSVDAQQGQIPWKSETFKGQFFEADIKAVLRQILKQNGVDAIFRPEVTGEVTMEFEQIPLEGAFNRVVGEYQLDYSYDESGKTVTVFKTEKQTGGTVFLVPKNMDTEQVLDALKKFELMGSDIKHYTDQATGALLFRGPAAKLGDIKRIVDDLDRAYLERSKNTFEIEKRRNEIYETASHQKRLQEADPARLVMEVRKLKFANVGTTSTSFQGTPVSLPGIVDSLKAFLGPIAKSGDEKKQAGAAGEAPQKVYPIVDVDNRTNSVIIQGTREQVDKVLAVLDKLDLPVPMIEIEVMIVTGHMGLTRDLGVQFGYKDSVSERSSGFSAVNTGAGVGAATAAGNVATATSAAANAVATARATGVNAVATPFVDPFSATGAGASFLVRGTRQTIAATLNALASDGTTQFISAPKVVTLNNRQAKVSNTNNVSISTTTGNNGASALQTVAAGLSLTITPSVIEDAARSDNRLVRMEIAATNTTPVVSSTANGTTINTSGQDIQTAVLIPEYSTFVLGGLFTDQRGETETGVPALMDVPIFGNLFKSTSSSNTKEENAFIMTPRIYDYEEILKPRKHWAKGYVEGQREILGQGQKGMLPEGNTSRALHRQEDE